MFNHKIFDTYCNIHKENLVADICLEPDCTRRLICESCRKRHPQSHNFIKPIIQLSKINLRKDFQSIKELHFKELEVLDSIIERIRQAFDEQLQITKEKILNAMPKQNYSKKDWDFIMNELETLYNEYFIVNVDFRDHENFDLLDVFTGKYANYLNLKSELESLIEERKRMVNIKNEAFESFDFALKKAMYCLRRPITSEEFGDEYGEDVTFSSKKFMLKDVMIQTKIEKHDVGIETQRVFLSDFGIMTDASVSSSKEIQTIDKIYDSRNIQTDDKAVENKDCQTIRKFFSDIELQTDEEEKIIVQKLNKILQTDLFEFSELEIQTDPPEIANQHLQTSFSEEEEREYMNQSTQTQETNKKAPRQTQTEEVIIKQPSSLITKGSQTEDDDVKEMRREFRNSDAQTYHVEVREIIEFNHLGIQTDDPIDKSQIETVMRAIQTEVLTSLKTTQTEVNTVSKSFQIEAESSARGIQTEKVVIKPFIPEEISEKSIQTEKIFDSKTYRTFEIQTEKVVVKDYIEANKIVARAMQTDEEKKLYSNSLIQTEKVKVSNFTDESDFHNKLSQTEELPSRTLQIQTENVFIRNISENFAMIEKNIQTEKEIIDNKDNTIQSEEILSPTIPEKKPETIDRKSSAIFLETIERSVQTSEVQPIIDSTSSPEISPKKDNRFNQSFETCQEISFFYEKPLSPEKEIQTDMNIDSILPYRRETVRKLTQADSSSRKPSQASEKKSFEQKLIQTEEIKYKVQNIQVSAEVATKEIQTESEIIQEEEKDSLSSSSLSKKRSRKFTEMNEFNAQNLIIERYLDITAACTAHSMRFIDEHDILIAGDKNGSITVWEGENYQKVFSANPHAKAITNVKFSPTFNYVITTSEDCSTKVWDVVNNTLKFKASFTGDAKSVMSVLIIDSIKLFFTCGAADPEIKVYDLNTLQATVKISTNSKSDMGAQMVHLQTLNAIAVGFNAGSIGIYGLKDYKELLVIKTYFGECNMNSIIYLEKQNLLFARVANKTIASWRIDSGRIAHLKEYTVGNNKPNIEAINEGKLLLVTTLEAMIYTIDPVSGTVTASGNIGLKHCNGMTYDSLRKKLFIGDGRYPKVAIINY